jgi:hypothetical protein
MFKKKLFALLSGLALLLSLGGLAAWPSLLAAEDGSSSGTSEDYLPEGIPTQTITNGDFRLDFSMNNLNFVLTNTLTGESLHSGRRALNDGLNSATWRGIMSDGLTVGYRNAGRTQMKPLSTLEPSISVTATGHTLKAAVQLTRIGISLEMDLSLDEQGQLSLEIPFSSIIESHKEEEDEEKRYQLAYLLPYLALGDSFGLQDEGSRLFVPDGCGAVADLSKPTIATAEYDHRIYGLDIGIYGKNGVLKTAASNPEKTIALPVSGLLYPSKPGLMLRVEGGAPYADIYASVSGLSTNYNFAAARFNYREEYYRYVDKAGNGQIDFLDEPYEYDAKLVYTFLPSGSALGDMATRYRSSLQDRGMLRSNYIQEAPVRLEWLMAESETTMFGQQEMTLSTPAGIGQALNELSTAGLSNPKTAFLGYQSGGWSNSDYSSFGYAVGAKQRDYENLAAKVSDLSFSFDYSLIRSSSRGYGDGDIAMTISNQGIYTYDQDTYALSESTEDRVMLTKAKSQEKLQLDLSHLGGLPKASLSLTDFSRSPFSSHFRYVANREQEANGLKALIGAGTLQSDVAMPNESYFSVSRSLLNLDWQSSAYYLAPDSVPFYQMVASGLYEMYSKPINLSYQKDTALRLIENDVNPNFLLTEKDPIALCNSQARFVFSSQYSSWKDKVVSIASTVKEALDNVRGSQMTSFRWLSKDVSLGGYANGKRIMVNHGTISFDFEGTTVEGGGWVII